MYLINKTSFILLFLICVHVTNQCYWKHHWELIKYSDCMSDCGPFCKDYENTTDWKCKNGSLENMAFCECCESEFHKLTYKGLYFRNLIK